MEEKRFPIGKFEFPHSYTEVELKEWISNIEQFPQRLEELIIGLSKEEFELTYRDKGWTIRQLIHHCADSHMNSLIRFKLALTEDVPTIKPYFENKWAELPDCDIDNLEDSLFIIKGIHKRLSKLLKSLDKSKLNREFFHPENKIKIKLWQNIALYSWHSNHHLAHVKLAVKS